MNLSGLIPPMITPLRAGGDVDGDAVEALVEHMIGAGVDGIFIMGSSGEGPWLSLAQRQQILEHTVRSVAGRVPVLAGALEPGTARTIEMIELIANCGAEAVVIAAPYYFAADAAVQLRHIRAVVSQSALPVVLYNIPPMTHSPITAETVGELGKLDNLIGIKDSAGDSANFEMLLRLKLQHQQFKVWQGAEKQAAEAMLAGADGLVCGLGNLVPEKFVTIMTHARKGDSAAAQVVQDEVNRLWELHTHGFWLACLKCAVSRLGFGDGSLSVPGMELSDVQKQAVYEVVDRLQ